MALIIDNSGSMGSTDPAGLRFAAARQFADLLEAGDEITVILFGDDGSVLVPLTQVSDEASREGIRAKLAPVAPAGNTNMKAGLELALAELEKGSPPTRLAIFLTDGELHPPGWEDFSASEQEAERTAVLDEAESFGERGWGLFPIALSGATDPEYLQELAAMGGGVYQQAPAAGELTLVFQEIFAARKLDEFDVLFDGCLAADEQTAVTFPIHEFVSSLSLFVTYVSDLRPSVSLEQPSGEAVDPTGGDVNFDSFNIESPARGLWNVSIAGAERGESCLTISSTPRTTVDVSLLRPPPSLNLSPEERLDIAIQLTASGESQAGLPLDDASVTAHVTDPAEQMHEVNLESVGGGEYRGTADLIPAAGQYVIEVVAETDEGVVARRRFETAISLVAASPTPTLTTVPTPGAKSAEGEKGGAPLLLILLGPVAVLGLAGPFAVYAHFWRPKLHGWLISPHASRGLAFHLATRHRHVWSRRALTVGGPKDDIDLGLARRLARLIPRRRGTCLLQALSKGVVVDGRELRKGKRRRLSHGSKIKLGEVLLRYQEHVGGPRSAV